MYCGWRADRYASGSYKPCPKCNGPVLPTPECRVRAPKGHRQALVSISPEDAAELRMIGNGPLAELIAQVVRGVMAQRRAKRLLEKS